jgi:LysR family transcriptional repressor of citA
MRTAKKQLPPIAYERNMAIFNSWKQGYKKSWQSTASHKLLLFFLPNLLNEFISKYLHIEVDIEILKSYDMGEKVSVDIIDFGLA